MSQVVTEFNYTHIYGLVAPRKCTECGDLMHSGYCIDEGASYYCKDECLYKNMTQEEYLELYDDGDGDSYWTEWELEDTCTDDIESKIEELTNVAKGILTDQQLSELNEKIHELEYLLNDIRKIDERMDNILRNNRLILV